MFPRKAFLHQAFLIGGISVWEWDSQRHHFLMLGQFGHYATDKPQTILQTDLFNRIHPDDRQQVQYQLTTSLENGGKFDIEFRLSNQDEIQWVLGLGERVSDRDQSKLIGIFIDASNQKKKAELLSKRQTQFANLVRLSSMGEMASLLAHEISQPLVVINTYIGGCIRRLEEDNWEKDKIIAAMRKANEHVELAGSLIHRLKNYIRKDGLHYQRVDLHKIIQSAVSLVGYESSEKPLNIHYDFAKLPQIKCDELQIKFVILSLLNNALESIIGSNSKRPKINIETSLLTDQAVKVSITDCGNGIIASLKEKIFNAYCSTKTDGTGLTLIICRSIIEAHSGLIGAENLKRGGAKFSFMLPI